MQLRFILTEIINRICPSKSKNFPQSWSLPSLPTYGQPKSSGNGPVVFCSLLFIAFTSDSVHPMPSSFNCSFWISLDVSRRSTGMAIRDEQRFQNIVVQLYYLSQLP